MHQGSIAFQRYIDPGDCRAPKSHDVLMSVSKKCPYWDVTNLDCTRCFGHQPKQ